MKAFNLEKALAGEKVITRDGREVTQLHKFNCDDNDCIHGVVDGSVENFYDCGSYHSGGICDADLFMAPKKLSGFVNIYRDDGELSLGCLHDDKAMCVANNNMQGKKAVACIDLSQFDEGHGL